MKKIREVLKKNDSIIVILVILLLSCGWCLNSYISEYDETWNFFNTCKILNGYKLYSDINIIITPLFFVLGSSVLKLFGAKLLVYRLYNLIIITMTYYLIYKIMKKLCKNKKRAFMYLLVIIITSITVSVGGANYNTLALTFVLLGIYLNLSWIENNKQNNIIQATIMFLVIMTKQNIGIYYIIGVCLYQLIANKDKIIDIIKQIIILSIEVSIVLLTFNYMGILYDFINMTFGGIWEFKKNNFFISSIIYLIIYITLIILPIETTIFLVKGAKTKEDKNKSILLMCMSIMMLLIQYPIFNESHIILSTVVIIMYELYAMDIFVLKYIINKSKIIKIISFLILIIYMCASMFYLYEFYKNLIKNNHQFSYNDYYYGVAFKTEEEYQNFETITNYIQDSNKRVVIFSYQASLYMIPFKSSNEAMDLPLLGNMGAKGEEGMLEKIQNLENVRILILKSDEELFWQESKMINQWIRNNLNYIGTIEQFEIYEK